MTIAIGMEVDTFLVLVNEVGKTEERDFGNGENNSLGFRYVEFELPAGHQMNIL